MALPSLAWMYRFSRTALSQRKGMSTALRIVFGALLMVIILALVVAVAFQLLDRGPGIVDVLSLENFLPGSGNGGGGGS